MTGSLRRLFVVGALGLAGAGCLGRSPAPRLYTLAPVAPAAPATAATGPVIGLGPVTLPGYLDRPQIVTRRSADELAAGEFDRWAEPLDEAVPRILGEDLAALLGTERLATYPWTRARGVTHQVTVDVLRFDGPLGGPVTLEARWRVLDPAGRELLVRRSTVREPTGGGDHAALVAAMSRALGALGRELADAVRGR
jgi:uncharacterized lipoprotein YmbA